MNSIRAFTTLALAAAFLASPATAQYMYLDSNGNGVHDSGDHLAANGSPTTVDVWLVTDHNRDGSPAVCNVDPSLGFPFQDYVFNLQATGGTVSYSGFITRHGNIAFGEFNPGDGLRYENGFGSVPILPPGTYRLATLTITGLTSFPGVQIVDRVTGSNQITGFGTGASGCIGNDFDNSIKLTGSAGGSDWTDVDGVAHVFIDAPPVLQQPADMTVEEGATVDQVLHGFDPNDQPLTFFELSGPSFFMTITTIDPTTGNIHLAPGLTDVGIYPAIVAASNGVLEDVKSFIITVAPRGGPPVLNPISDMTVAEGGAADQAVSGFDPDQAAPLTFFKESGPLFMTVQTTSPTTGNIHLVPGFADAGSYTGIVRATTNGAFFGEQSFLITVTNVCRIPEGDIGGPYTGVVGIPIAFDGSGSFDQDGGVLTYLWDFGDGTTATGATPSHTYSVAGTYNLALSVTNPCGLVGGAAIRITISDACLSALAFTQGGNNKTSLGSGKRQTCVQIQPTSGAFAIEDVDLASVVMISPGTGSVSEIHAVSNKTSLGADKNGDGIEEIAACFTKADLQQLFSNIVGTQVVTVTLQGSLFTGGSFCTTLEHTVKSGGGSLAASVTPNPLNPSAVLRFATPEAGPVRVQLFDVRGRLLRTVRDDPDASAGRHEMTIDGLADGGARLGSGIYYLRIQAAGVEERKTITILK